VSFINFRTYRRTGTLPTLCGEKADRIKLGTKWERIPFGFSLWCNGALIYIHFDSECTVVLTYPWDEILKQSADFRMKIVPYSFNWRPINFHP
jgi:hypothetical protein